MRTRSASEPAPIFRIMCAAVDLHGYFGELHFAGDLLVEQAFGDVAASLPVRAGSAPRSGRAARRSLLRCPACTITLDGERHRIQHVLIAKRLCQEVDGAGLHRAHRHRNVAVAGHEYDWKMDSRLDERGFENRDRSRPAAGCRARGSSARPAAWLAAVRRRSRRPILRARPTETDWQVRPGRPRRRRR